MPILWHYTTLTIHLYALLIYSYSVLSKNLVEHFLTFQRKPQRYGKFTISVVNITYGAVVKNKAFTNLTKCR